MCGIGSSDSKLKEPESESGYEVCLESYSDSDSGARIITPLPRRTPWLFCITGKERGAEVLSRKDLIGILGTSSPI